MATQIDKLTINFNARPTFRQGDETIDLKAKKDTLEVIGKDGQKKTIEGFKSESGTFFRLKEKNGQFQIVAYGTPEQLAKSNLRVRNGDLTKARFGDQRFDQISPFKPKEAFAIRGSDLRNADDFAKHFHLTRRPGEGVDTAPSDKLRGEKSDAPPKDQDALMQEALARDKAEIDRIHAEYMAAGGDKPVNMKALFEAAAAKKAATAQPEPEQANAAQGNDLAAEAKAPTNALLDIDRGKKGEDAIKQEQRLEQPSEQPPEQPQAKPLDQSQAKPVDQSPAKPELARPAVITEWEQRAAKMSSVQMVKQLPGAEIWSALRAGEITLETYERALQEKISLTADDRAHWLREGRKDASEGRLPNPDTVSLDKQRARFVRDMVQRDLAQGLNHRHVWHLYMDGKITDRAYGMILRQQKIENRMPTSSRPKGAENNAKTVDLALLVNHRKLELHQISMYKDEPLGVLADKHKSGDLSDVAYDSILESQKRRGRITEAQFNASTTLKSF